MGFFVAESLNFPQYGVDAENCYVTIKATYTHIKSGAPVIGMYAPPNSQPGQYVITARFFVYADNDPDLSPLRETFISLTSEEPFTDPIASLYTAIKSEHFAGKTITDDI